MHAWNVSASFNQASSSVHHYHTCIKKVHKNCKWICRKFTEFKWDQLEQNTPSINDFSWVTLFLRHPDLYHGHQTNNYCVRCLAWEPTYSTFLCFAPLSFSDPYRFVSAHHYVSMLLKSNEKYCGFSCRCQFSFLSFFFLEQTVDPTESAQTRCTNGLSLSLSLFYGAGSKRRKRISGRSVGKR